MAVAVTIVLRDVARVTLAALALGALVGGAVAIAASVSLRAWFGLTPGSPAAIPAWELWADNARALLPVFGAALAVVWWPRARVATDILVCLLIGGNVTLVAVAFGAYGEALLMVAPAHWPLELLALATAGAAYLDARREGEVRWRVWGGCALAAAVLLAGAALAEGT